MAGKGEGKCEGYGKEQKNMRGLRAAGRPERDAVDIH